MEITLRLPDPRTLAIFVTTLLVVLATAVLLPDRGPTEATGATTIAQIETQSTLGSLGLDSSGRPVISYVQAPPGVLKVARCLDSVCSSTNAIAAIDSIGTPVGGTSLALGVGDVPTIAYSRAAVFSDLRVARCDNSACSGPPSINTVDLGPGTGPVSLRLDTAGNPVVAYVSGNGDLKVLHCDDADCDPGGDSITIPDATSDFRYPSLALDGSGLPVVAYYDSLAGDLKVLRCNDVNCAPGGDFTNVADLTGDVGRESSLVLDATENPVISYYDVSNGDLKVMHCNATCSGGTTEIVDAAGDVGRYTSLALDDGGLPVVSYADVTNGDLKVVRCNDADCSGSDELISTVDNIHATGGFTSLEMDASGNAVVSYTGGASNELKLLHCGDAACAIKPSSVEITDYGQYLAPNSCYEVRDSNQAHLFDMCDNGTPPQHVVCDGDGTVECEDADPTKGKLSIALDQAVYEIVQTTAPPNHALDMNELECKAATNSACAVTFANTPYVRPWHPWDIVSGPNGGADGFVRVNDILSVVGHYFQDKPLE